MDLHDPPSVDANPSNVTFYIGDISKLEDVSNAVVKVSHACT